MKNYRLKKEAVPFFKDEYAPAIYPLDEWESLCVDIKALEEVEYPYLTFGNKDMNNRTNVLGGWKEENGTYFHFTIHFPSVKHMEHDQFSKGKNTRELMNIIQRDINSFYADYVNDQNQ